MKVALKFVAILVLSFAMPVAVHGQDFVSALAGEFETAEAQQAAILKSLEGSGALESWPERAVSHLRAWKALLDDEEAEAPRFLAEECFASGCVFHLRYPDPATIQTSESLLLEVEPPDAWNGPIAITAPRVTSAGEIESMVVLLNE